MRKTRKGSNRRRQTRKMKGGENTLNLSALKAAALQARATKAWPKPPSYPKGTPKPAVLVNAPNYSKTNLVGRFLREQPETYTRSRRHYVLKDLLVMLMAEQRCKGSVILNLPDLELKVPYLQELYEEYAKSLEGVSFLRPSEFTGNQAVVKVLRSLLDPMRPSVDCKTIEKAVTELKKRSDLIPPGGAPYESLLFLKSPPPGYTGYNRYKNHNTNIIWKMLWDEKISPDEDALWALEQAPKLGLSVEQLKEMYTPLPYPETLKTYVLFLQALDEKQKAGSPIKREFVESIAKDERIRKFSPGLLKLLSMMGSTVDLSPAGKEKLIQTIVARLQREKEQEDRQSGRQTEGLGSLAIQSAFSF